MADSSTQIQGGIDALVGGLNSLDEAITAYQQSLEAAGATDMAQKNTQAVEALRLQIRSVHYMKHMFRR